MEVATTSPPIMEVLGKETITHLFQYRPTFRHYENTHREKAILIRDVMHIQ